MFTQIFNPDGIAFAYQGIRKRKIRDGLGLGIVAFAGIQPAQANCKPQSKV
jgi:hypothetical protein